VLQKNKSANFLLPTAVVYNGTGTVFRSLGTYSLVTEYYRVKAKGGLTWLDSPWSNIVQIGGVNRPPKNGQGPIFRPGSTSPVRPGRSTPPAFGGTKHSTGEDDDWEEVEDEDDDWDDEEEYEDDDFDDDFEKELDDEDDEDWEEVEDEDEDWDDDED
jgi:hypothetical protein